MPLNDSDIDSDDNFHNDDSVNAVEDVAMVPAMCCGVCVAGVKCTAGWQTEHLDEYQGVIRLPRTATNCSGIPLF